MLSRCMIHSLTEFISVTILKNEDDKVMRNVHN
jgi:hypothetical protein